VYYVFVLRINKVVPLSCQLHELLVQVFLYLNQSGYIKLVLTAPDYYISESTDLDIWLSAGKI